MSNRIIFHLDMDAFFASVEIVKNPKLKGKPVIVGGNPEKRGVVSTCSYEARRYGVHSAMSMFEARKRCPSAIFLEGDFETYRQYSNHVMETLYEVTHKVEIVGIDEAYLDVTDLTTSPKELGKELRKRIYNDTELTCSIGIASNKLVAKIASSIGKPNGLYEIPPGLEAQFLATLPIGKIYGIGPKTEEFFRQEGIETIADLQKMSLEELTYKYDYRGYHYYYLARGIDNRPVEWEPESPKQVGAETTFNKDLTDRESLIIQLDYVLEKAYKRLEREHMLTRGLSLKLRDHHFYTITRSTTLPTHTKDFHVLSSTAKHLFECSWSFEKPLRLIGVAFEKLTDSYWQPLLWPWENNY